MLFLIVTKECWIIDPVAIPAGAESLESAYLEKNELKPVKLLNTHCHLDHIYGNKFYFG